MQTVELIGAESVGAAGRAISQAAGEVRSAAGSMSEAARQGMASAEALCIALQRHSEHLDDWLERYRQLLRDQRDGRL